VVNNDIKHSLGHVAGGHFITAPRPGSASRPIASGEPSEIELLRRVGRVQAWLIDLINDLQPAGADLVLFGKCCRSLVSGLDSGTTANPGYRARWHSLTLILHPLSWLPQAKNGQGRMTPNAGEMTSGETSKLAGFESPRVRPA
jgi:hypothetical protein